MSTVQLKVKTLLVTLVPIAAIIFFTPAWAQDAHEVVRNSSVYIEASGQTANGIPHTAVGTGFFVDKDGLILTSYHLINFLEEKKVAPETVQIKISIGNKISPNIPAQIVDAKQAVDLLLLKIAPNDAPAATPIRQLHLGQISDLPKQTTVEVLTSGFRGVGSPSRVSLKAQIIGREGPGGYTWILDKKVEGGQSGSPVYIQDANGAVKVVGVIKGLIGEQEGVFVPISHAESLLLPIRMRELSERIDRISEPPDEAIEKYLQSARGSKVLAAWFNSHLKTYVDQEVDQFLDENQKKIDVRLDRYMANVVAYSYSSEFSFTGKRDDGQKRYFVLPFYKTSEDMGDLRCEVTYQSNKIKNNVFYKLNDLKEQQIHKSPDLRTALNKKLVRDNRSLYDGLVPADPEPSPYQKIMFWVDDQDEFDGRIAFLCTILIVGSAKVAR